MTAADPRTPAGSARELTGEQAAAVAAVLADLTRAWADPHQRDTIRQIVRLSPGDAHEDMRTLYAARMALDALIP